MLLNSAIFIMFAFSFFKPQTARDWRTFGAFAAGDASAVRRRFDRYAASTPRFIPSIGRARKTA